MHKSLLIQQSPISKFLRNSALNSSKAIQSLKLSAHLASQCLSLFLIKFILTLQSKTFLNQVTQSMFRTLNPSKILTRKKKNPFLLLTQKDLKIQSRLQLIMSKQNGAKKTLRMRKINQKVMKNKKKARMKMIKSKKKLKVKFKFLMKRLNQQPIQELLKKISKSREIT